MKFFDSVVSYAMHSFSQTFIEAADHVFYYLKLLHTNCAYKDHVP